MQLSDRIGRRMKLHDLHVLMSVMQSGSMGKAAALLNTTQSAVSRSIAELEHVLGVRLLDRSRHGVEPTEFGRALLDGGAAVFDDLRQTVKRIEFMADPTVGSLMVGGQESMSAGLLPAAFARLRRQHPGLSMHVTPALSVAQQYEVLRERKVDLIVGRIPPVVDKDIDVEILLRDPLFVVAGVKNRWARRRKVDLGELAHEPWVLPPLDTLVGSLVADVFRKSNMEFPPRGAATGSIHLCSALVATGPFIAMFPGSVLRLGGHLPPLKVLPVTLPTPPWPIGLMTLKNRTLSPITKLFIDCLREVTKPLARQAL
jgi:DNA-binding transcriptional LysR family regulator